MSIVIGRKWAYYNEFDPYAAQWIRNLMAAGHIAAGEVDERSIRDVRPADLRGFTQGHFFAGVAVWSHAFRLAGIPDDYPVWSGSCPCFPAGTLVITRRGYVAIEDVLVGDDVLTHRARWRPVTATGSEEADLVRVRGQGHCGLETTLGHPFLTGDDEWTYAVDLKGKRWRTVAEFPSADIPNLQNERGVQWDRGRWRAGGWKNGRFVYLGRFKTEDEARERRQSALVETEVSARGADNVDVTALPFARFLGYWVGDGWTSRNNVVLCGAKGDQKLLEEILHATGMAGSFSLERTGMRARVGSAALAAWLNENFGKTAAGKRLPSWLHGASPEYREAFLAGYAEADGHREPFVRRWTTVSRALAIGVRVLLNQQHISASITKHKPNRQVVIEGRSVSEKPFFRVTAYEAARSFRFEGLHGVGLVRSVEPAGRGRVYNLSVGEDETYTADGIVVHNCQPWSQAGKGKGFDDDRHLWPAFYDLIRECRPSRVYGEQVGSVSVVGSAQTLQKLRRREAGGLLSAPRSEFQTRNLPRLREFLGASRQTMEGAQETGISSGAPQDAPGVLFDSGCPAKGQGEEFQIRSGLEGNPSEDRLRNMRDNGNTVRVVSAEGVECTIPRSDRPQGRVHSREYKGRSVCAEHDGERLGDGTHIENGRGHQTRTVREAVEHLIQGDSEPDEGKCGLAWIDNVEADLVGAGYAFGAYCAPACSVGAPHKRHRLYWFGTRGDPGRRLGQPSIQGPQGQQDGFLDVCRQSRETAERAGGEPSGPMDGAGHRPGPLNGFWRDADWLRCRDGRWRPAKPGSSVLVAGASSRMGRLRAFGNSIVAPQAALFVKATLP